MGCGTFCFLTLVGGSALVTGLTTDDAIGFTVAGAVMLLIALAGLFMKGDN